MFETWLELSPEFKFPFSRLIIRRIWTNGVASLSHISSSWQAKWGVIVNSFYRSIWPKLNLQLTSVVRSFAFPQLSWDLSTGAKAEAERPSGRLLIQCERPVYKQTAAMGLNETNIPWKKKKKNPPYPRKPCQGWVWQEKQTAAGYLCGKGKHWQKAKQVQLRLKVSKQVGFEE